MINVRMCNTSDQDMAQLTSSLPPVTRPFMDTYRSSVFASDKVLILKNLLPLLLICLERSRMS